MASSLQRAEELAYVTAHLRDMQGAIGVPFVLAFSTWVFWVHLHGFCVQQLWFFGLAVLFGLIAGGAVQRWYRRRFGFVKQPNAAVSQGLQLLSLSSPAPLPPPRYKGNYTQGLRIGYIAWGGVNIVSAITDNKHLHGLSLLLLFNLPLLPRCFFRTPPSVLLQLRRGLSVVALLTLILLLISFTRMSVAKWDLVNAILAGYLVIVAYDHWLLLHMLGGASLMRREAASE